MAPAVPPIPTTLPTAERGNMSDAMVNMLADQPWCADIARLTRPTTGHMLFENGASRTGVTHWAQASMSDFRAALMLQPLLIKLEEIQPPAMLPTLDAL